MKKRFTVSEVNKLTGIDELTIREGLKRKQLPIGAAVKTSTRYTYIITRKKLEEFWGEIDESKLD